MYFRSTLATWLLSWNPRWTVWLTSETTMTMELLQLGVTPELRRTRSRCIAGTDARRSGKKRKKKKSLKSNAKCTNVCLGGGWICVRRQDIRIIGSENYFKREKCLFCLLWVWRKIISFCLCRYIPSFFALFRCPREFFSNSRISKILELIPCSIFLVLISTAVKLFQIWKQKNVQERNAKTTW